MKKKRSYTRPLFRAKREPEIVEPEELAPGEAAAVGDTVVRRPATFGRGRMRGRVVYVHPAGRFHVVEFETRGGGIRECFWRGCPSAAAAAPPPRGRLGRGTGQSVFSDDDGERRHE